MLRCYTYWLDLKNLEGKRRISETAVAFYTWAKSRQETITTRRYKHEKPDIPIAVGAFAKAMIAGKNPTMSDRRAFMRYLQKARNLSRNAAQGVFPGKY